MTSPTPEIMLVRFEMHQCQLALSAFAKVFPRWFLASDTPFIVMMFKVINEVPHDKFFITLRLSQVNDDWR